MAAQARLAGLDVGTKSVTCSLGLRPVAQPAPFTSTVDRGPKTMNTDKTTIRTAKLRTVRSRRMLVKGPIKRILLMPTTIVGEFSPVLRNRPDYDIPNREPIMSWNERAKCRRRAP